MIFAMIAARISMCWTQRGPGSAGVRRTMSRNSKIVCERSSFGRMASNCASSLASDPGAPVAP